MATVPCRKEGPNFKEKKDHDHRQTWTWIERGHCSCILLSTPPGLMLMHFQKLSQRRRHTSPVAKGEGWPSFSHLQLPGPSLFATRFATKFAEADSGLKVKCFLMNRTIFGLRGLDEWKSGHVDGDTQGNSHIKIETPSSGHLVLLLQPTTSREFF